MAAGGAIITAFELAVEKRTPLVLFVASGVGPFQCKCVAALVIVVGWAFERWHFAGFSKAQEARKATVQAMKCVQRLSDLAGLKAQWELQEQAWELATRLEQLLTRIESENASSFTTTS